MIDDTGPQIELDAVSALANWKHMFGLLVRKNAQKIAAESNHNQPITLTHYEQAARIAVAEFSEAMNAELDNGKRKAA